VGEVLVPPAGYMEVLRLHPLLLSPLLSHLYPLSPTSSLSCPLLSPVFLSLLSSTFSSPPLSLSYPLLPLLSLSLSPPLSPLLPLLSLLSSPPLTAGLNYIIFIFSLFSDGQVGHTMHSRTVGKMKLDTIIKVLSQLLAEMIDVVLETRLNKTFFSIPPPGFGVQRLLKAD